MESLARAAGLPQQTSAALTNCVNCKVCTLYPHHGFKLMSLHEMLVGDLQDHCALPCATLPLHN